MQKTTPPLTSNLLTLSLVAALAVTLGCAKAHKPDAVTLQGKWTGEEAGAPAKGINTLALTGSNLEFHGVNTNEWYKGTYTLHEDANPKQMIVVVTDCPAPQYVGKTANAIYQIVDGALTITANEPGNPAFPAAFNAPNMPAIVFKMEKP